MSKNQEKRKRISGSISGNVKRIEDQAEIMSFLLKQTWIDLPQSRNGLRLDFGGDASFTYNTLSFTRINFTILHYFFFSTSYD